MKESTRQILNYFNKGYTMIDVSKMLNINYKIVESIKRRYKIDVNKASRNNANHHYLDLIDDDMKAYILGFFIADGCIQENGRISFNISEDDEYILYKIKDCFKVNSIFYKDNQNGVLFRKRQAVYRFSSKILLSILENKYNIHPKKTYDSSFKFPFKTIPTEYHGSFIRGLWDGDGCYESHKSTFNPTCCINSKLFAKQIGNIIKNNTGLNFKIYEHQGKTCKYYILRLHANRVNKLEKIKKLYNFLYCKDTISLIRKKEKFINYLEYRANSAVNKAEQCNA